MVALYRLQHKAKNHNRKLGMKIYTRMGDGGETGLLGGRRAPKTDPIFELLGSLDETNASLGVAASHLRSTKFPVKCLFVVQATILSIGACIADDEPTKAKILNELDNLTDSLEEQIDQWDKALPPLKNFILPEGTPGAASLHACRTLARRTERAFHDWPKSGDLAPVGRYLNRLSDYLFQAARYANKLADHTEQIWYQ